MSRRAAGGLFRIAVGITLGVPLDLARSLFGRAARPPCVVYDAARAATWRAMVEAADRFDVFPDDEPVPYLPTEKASA